MKIALGMLVAALSVWASGCCGGPGVALVPADGASSWALLAGGARAGLRVVGAGEALPTGLTLVSSDPTVVEVVVAPDAQGHSVVKTGTPGAATLTLRDPAGNVLDVREVSVRQAAQLVARFPDGASAGRAAANEVVGLRLVPQDADGVALVGSGLVEARIGGTGTRADGAAPEGVERVFLTGTPGKATVRATLGALALDATVAFAVPKLFVSPTLSNSETSCAVGRPCDTKSTTSVEIAVHDGAGDALAGGRCTWTVTGNATLLADDSAIDTVELRAGARVASFDVPPGDDAAVATCTFGRHTSAVTLRYAKGE